MPLLSAKTRGLPLTSSTMRLTQIRLATLVLVMPHCRKKAVSLRRPCLRNLLSSLLRRSPTLDQARPAMVSAAALLVRRIHLLSSEIPRRRPLGPPVLISRHKAVAFQRLSQDLRALGDHFQTSVALERGATLQVLQVGTLGQRMPADLQIPPALAWHTLCPRALRHRPQTLRMLWSAAFLLGLPAAAPPLT